MSRRRAWRTHESYPAAAHLAAAEQVARADLTSVDRRVAAEDMVESVLIGTVQGETVFSALRSEALRHGRGTAGAERELTGRGIMWGMTTTRKAHAA
ncbi:hypothetical protein ACGFZB_27545 [Streptomyces cinerochromogenes]|uniref:Uncharacterized protein n=1 Tax=Streptomyces cinerochromogenes TaxID=66422 RepID=A0ABW7BDW6_9ACTN